MSAARLGALSLVLLAGCASARPLQLNSNVPIGADDYEDVLESWTRADEIYHNLGSVLFAHATFHSAELRRAFLLRHPNVYGPGSEEAAHMTLTKVGAEAGLEFFFSASTTDPEWNDFERADSIWRITLQTDQGPLVDAKVERLRTSANLRVFYPFISPFAKTYRVTFPLSVAGTPILTSKTKVVRLNVISALGTASMQWRLTPS